MQCLETACVLILISLRLSYSLSRDEEKVEFCKELDCEDDRQGAVCGFRFEGEGVRLKLFGSECDMMKYGCNVTEEEEYGMVKLDLCLEPKTDIEQSVDEDVRCPEFDCSYPGDDVTICAIRKYEDGYKVRLFKNKCQMFTHNCKENVTFDTTEMYYCVQNDSQKYDKTSASPEKLKNLIVVTSDMLAPGANINETIDTFFAATHIMNLPLTELNISDGNASDSGSDNYRRSVRVPIMKLVKTFKPWTIRPDKIKTDRMYKPLINSCYHKCPVKCPDIYAPVCGKAGVISNNPNIMFRNHCYMDYAHCKVYFENRSYYAVNDVYVENSFVFCLGEQYGNYMRFVPAVRSLQRMGRLKKKAKYRHVITKFKNFYGLLKHDFNIRG